MTASRDPIEDVAAALADELLFARALDVDRRGRVPVGHLRSLAAAGLFGIAGPRAAGGADCDARTRRRVRELLAGGCLTTAFVWAQHQGVVARLRAGARAALQEAWLPDLCAGRTRGGLALAGLLPGPPRLRAAPATGGGVRIDGSAPAVSGWGYVDVLLVVARSGPREVTAALVDVADPGLHAQRRRLAVLDGTRTVALRFDGVRAAADAVVGTSALPAWESAGEGVRANGAHAIGVAARCARIAGEAALLDAVAQRRAALDDAADGDELAAARADAALLAVRAASILVAARGSAAVDDGEHAQRLMREAMFLLAFGQRPAIRAQLLRRLLA